MSTRMKVHFSVTEVYEILGLSRGRFYQLLEFGVFPPPVYFTCSRRPIYTKEQVEECLAIRSTSVGFNGQPVLFYKKHSASRESGYSEQQYMELADILKGLRTAVDANQVKKAAKILFPEGLPKNHKNRDVISKLIQFFQSHQ